jgi:type IV pilus assembly protein PilP
MSKHARLLLALPVAALLAACSAADENEIRKWMDQTRAGMKPTTQPVPEPKTFTPQVYDGKAVTDPFDAQKMLVAVARQAAARASASALKPDLDRRREPLESYPLDQLKMVGMLRQGGANVALVDVGGQTYMVRVGNYLGQNFGRVNRITETETQLNEIVQDAAGEWVERPSKLELQVAAASAQGSKR